MMTLEELGYSHELEAHRKEQGLDSFAVARVASEHKDRYTVRNQDGEFEAELLGNLRFSASSRKDLPAVGDWVAISEYDEGKALIHAVFPRKTMIERKAVGKFGESQVIATNIDVGLIIQSVNRDFSINRLERYLTICNAAKIKAILLLSKVDLIDESQLLEIIRKVKGRIKDTPVMAISNQSQLGIEELRAELQKGKTYCLLGSSGVGKSTLINTLTGEERMETDEISERIDRGKHVTSHRELIVFDKGILIDNPGMREVGIADSAAGLEMTFDEISQLARECRYKDCTHTAEDGCAVQAAIEDGSLSAESYTNYVKMEKEQQHFDSDAQERKKKDKDLGKLIKRVLKEKRDTEF